MTVGNSLFLRAKSAGAASQTIAFGANTLASAGGAKALNAQGAEIDFVSVTGQGGATRTWSVSGGRLIANGTPGVDDGKVLTCTVTGGTSISVTISAIANGYSFKDLTDFAAIYALSTATTAGCKAYARAGTYARPPAITKTWASDFTITKHAGAAAIFEGFDIHTATHVVIDGLEIYKDTDAVEALIDLYSGADNIIFRNNSFHAKYYDPSIPYGAPTTKTVGILTDGSTRPGTVLIEDNAFYDLYRGMALSIATSITIRRNSFHTIASDGIYLAEPGSGTFPTTVVQNNDIVDLYTTDPADHGDAIQFDGVASGGASGDWTISVTGNRIVQSSVVPAGAIAQGIFAKTMPSGQYFTGTISGNVLALKTEAGFSLNNISVFQAKAMTISNNTVVRSNHTSGGSGTQLINIGETTTSGTHVLSNNVAEGISAGGSPTLTNNVSLGADGGTIAYSTAFDGSAGSFVPASIAQAVIMFAPKDGGPLDVVPLVGAIS